MEQTRLFILHGWVTDESLFPFSGRVRLGFAWHITWSFGVSYHASNEVIVVSAEHVCARSWSSGGNHWCLGI